MMRRTWLGLILLAALVASASANAEVFRWVDKQGKVHYSDQPPNDADAQTPKLVNNRIDVDKLSYEMRKAVEKYPLTLYTSPECKEPCDSARKFLGGLKYPFAEKSVKSPEEVQALGKLVGKTEPLAPTLMIGNRAVEGFEQDAWNNALNAAGYPKK